MCVEEPVASLPDPSKALGMLPPAEGRRCGAHNQAYTCIHIHSPGYGCTHATRAHMNACTNAHPSTHPPMDPSGRLAAHPSCYPSLHRSILAHICWRASVHHACMCTRIYKPNMHSCARPPASLPASCSPAGIFAQSHARAAFGRLGRHHAGEKLALGLSNENMHAQTYMARSENC